MDVDVVDLIMQDHREVERLFEELKSHKEKRPLLMPVLAALITAHSRAEESEVYPVAKEEVGETDEVAHSQAEHVQAELMLAELMDQEPDSKRFDEMLTKLEDAITHHVQEEESSVLPRMRQRLTAARRAELGAAFAASRKQHLGEMPGEATKEELMAQARNAGITGASTMTRKELVEQLTRSTS